MQLQYEIRIPEKLSEDTQMLILLHGYGSNEQDLFSFAPTLPAEWLIVSFRAPLSTPYEGFAWYDINFMDAEKFIDVPQALESLNAALEGIMQLKKEYGIRDGQVHLAGFSQGGILCYALALKNPHIFSKIACLSCYPEQKILSDISKDKKALQKLRFFISHGTDDAVIPLEWARKGADLLYDLGCYFTFREYMAGHGVNQKNYMDLMQFFGE